MLTKALGWSAACTALLAAATLFSGCEEAYVPQTEPTDNMQQVVYAILAYHEANQKWPDKLDEAKSMVGKPWKGGALVGYGKDWDTMMKSNQTGENPGFEYVKPEVSPENDPPAIMLYQLKGGKRDTAFPVAYSDGGIRPAK